MAATTVTTEAWARCHCSDLWGLMQNVADYGLENGGIVQLWAGPIIAYGPTWRIHNKLLSPSFNQQVLNTFLPEMNVQARNMVSQMTTVAGKGPVDIKEFITQYILRSVCRTSLGLESKDQDIIDNGYAKALEEIFRIVCYRALNVDVYLSCIYYWTSMGRRELELVKVVKKMINPIIQKRKSELKPTNIDNYDSSTTGKFKPTLDLMLDLSNEQNVLSDDDIRAHLNTFVAASYDTTSAVLHNALMVLGSYPNVQERVYEELQDVFQNNDELTKYDMSKLVYLEAVLKEVLRVYVAAPLVARKIDADIVLPKYTLRAGSICVVSIYGLHRHPSWGPDAKEFKPERWLNPDTLPTNPNVYAPFSFGKRNCIGMIT
ncbi:cytochrome P450 4C1-like [Spodoptera litura]|uniref:Cytochrome P450 4C1-like n=1 Tax=Spodoptera litura TaxID=69820 RepID=A0A9J7EEK0_SPOLT|nr:cytochrome P450 4C1-like [Spodoptera litura]